MEAGGMLVFVSPVVVMVVKNGIDMDQLPLHWYANFLPSTAADSIGSADHLYHSYLSETRCGVG